MADDDYVLTPQPQDADELKAEVAAYLRGVWPEWQPAEGNLDWQIISAFAERAAIIQESVTDVLREVFRYYGEHIAGVPPINATVATGTVTLTTIDTAGYTIPAGEVFGFTAADGTLVGFSMTAEATIAPGSASAVGVPVVALEPGALGSGIEGEGDFTLAALESVVLDGVTTGGRDAESIDTYLLRLKEELALSTPRPILARDYEVLARRFPEVHSALALDNYNGATYDVEGALAVALRGFDGLAVPGSTKTAVQAMYDAEKLPGLTVAVIDATYTPVAVTFAITPWEGDFDPEAVRVNAEAAVAAFLSPVSWGQPRYGEVRRWVQESRVRFLEAAQAIQEVEGVRYLDSLVLSAQQAVVTDDFEANNLSKWTVTQLGGGSVATTTGSKFAGTYGVHIGNDAVSGSQANLRKSFSAVNDVEIVAMCRWNSDSGSSVTNGGGLRLFAGGTRIVDVHRQDATGKIVLRTLNDAATQVFTETGQTLSLGTWVKLSMRVIYRGAGAVSTVIVKVNDVERINASAYNLSAGGFTIAQIGVEHPQVVNFDADDVSVLTQGATSTNGDLILPGAAPLPTPGTITGSVT